MSSPCRAENARGPSEGDHIGTSLGSSAGFARHHGNLRILRLSGRVWAWFTGLVVALLCGAAVSVLAAPGRVPSGVRSVVGDSVADLVDLGPTPMPPVPAPAGTEWNLAFEDTFSGSKLDSDRWTRCYWWSRSGCTNAGNNELQWYRPGNVKVADGRLHLIAREDKVRRDGTDFDYTSGMVTTGPAPAKDGYAPPGFAFTYGYAEIRAKFPAGRGLWPAFWLMSADRSWPPEIDIVEVLGHRPARAHFTVHYGDRRDGLREKGVARSVPATNRGVHTYAVDWRPGSITWYMDGKQMWRYTDEAGIPHEKMYLLLNLAVGGDWPGNPDSDTRFPAAVEVKHVRVWQGEP